MTPTEEQIARRRAATHRLAVVSLMNDLRAAGLDLVWLWGETPALCDGKGSPPEVLAARHCHLARRVDELLGPGGSQATENVARQVM